MRDKELYRQLLGVQEPWRLLDIDVNMTTETVIVHMEYDPLAKVHCPLCKATARRYDTNHRSWRHLDTMQYITMIEADIPRVECPEHGVHQIDVPWAEYRSHFTARFEALVIDWLHEASTSAVAEALRLKWDVVDGIRKRAVERGIERRESMSPTNLMVDEVSIKRGHKYVTVVSDNDTGAVLDVVKDRKKESFEGFLQSMTEPERDAIETITMDMSIAYINAALDNVKDASSKICFDRFHVSKVINEGVDKTRRQEHKQLMAAKDDTLSKTRYDWLREPTTMSRKQWRSFSELASSTLKTAKAWALKELAKLLWNYKSTTWAVKMWMKWYRKVMRSKLEYMKEAATTIYNHLYGIVNAIVHAKTNAMAESINSKIKSIKSRARGFRTWERMRIAILFDCGQLDMYPKLCAF